MRLVAASDAQNGDPGLSAGSSAWAETDAKTARPAIRRSFVEFVMPYI
ncbi:MAG: hypothetical protein HY075_02180 [Deltaproteobacteria bacterium]|nr:hypothetical protein [Deltaproteobacteria bacterium]